MPALGLGVAVLAGLVWDRLALTLHGWWGIGPLVVAGGLGWIVAWLRTTGLRGASGGHAPRGPGTDGPPSNRSPLSGPAAP